MGGWYIIFLKAQIVFLNNQQIKGDALDVWQECLDRWKEDTPNNEIAALGFFAYNFKSVLLVFKFL